MAIIKTSLTDNVRRIVSTVSGDQRRISCSCCENVCCMYPAEQLGITYQSEDLPILLDINWPNQLVGTLNKDQNSYSGSGVSLEIVDNKWMLIKGGESRAVGKCLIIGDGALVSGNDLVEDQFEDSYTIDFRYQNIGNSEGWIEEQVVVTRFSRCVWRGEDQCGNPVSLEYQGSGSGSYADKWNIYFFTNTTGTFEDPVPCTGNDEWVIVKGAELENEYQDTPVGLYGAGGLSYDDFFGANVS